MAFVQPKCRKIDDDLRWLVAPVTDTGMRLAEAAGMLTKDFIHANGGSIYARIRGVGSRRREAKATFLLKVKHGGQQNV
jgi:hypothetical protein